MGLTAWLARHVSDYTTPTSVASRLRRRRSGPLVALMRQAFKRRGHVELIDIGGTPTYWRMLTSDVLDACDVSVTLVNLSEAAPASLDRRFKYLEADACDLSRFKDGAFDIAHSNSVIEHVGDWERMAAFAAELRRVGRSYFVQTPYFWFPIEPHFMTPFFHWLPEPLRLALLRRTGLGHRARQPSVAGAAMSVGGIHLLDRTMFRALFPDATVHFERVFGIPKALIAVRAEAAPLPPAA